MANNESTRTQHILACSEYVSGDTRAVVALLKQFAAMPLVEYLRFGREQVEDIVMSLLDYGILPYSTLSEVAAAFDNAAADGGMQGDGRSEAARLLLRPLQIAAFRRVWVYRQVRPPCVSQEGASPKSVPAYGERPVIERLLDMKCWDYLEAFRVATGSPRVERDQDALDLRWHGYTDPALWKVLAETISASPEVLDHIATTFILHPLADCKDLVPASSRPKTIPHPVSEQFRGYRDAGDLPDWEELQSKLGVRAGNCLRRWGKIHTTEELLGKTPWELLKLRKFNLRCLEEVEQALADYGLELAYELGPTPSGNGS